MVVAAFLVWWFLIRTPTGKLEVTLRPNPDCPPGNLCERVPRVGKLFLFGGPSDHPLSYDPDSGFYRVIEIDWSHPTLNLELPASHYGVEFLIPPQTALATTRGQAFRIDIQEGRTLHLGELMPAARDVTFPAFGD